MSELREGYKENLPPASSCIIKLDIGRPDRWLVSGLISPADVGLLWEENTISWLISYD